MLTIDADAHVIETERTWQYLEESDRRYRPIPVTVDMPSGRTRNFWLIDARLVGGRDNVGKETPKESREMADIEARLRHMDEIGTDVQVLYPTLFLRPVTDRPEVELALCRAYNRWLADIWSKGKGRLRWAVQLPLMTMDKALDELRWAREHGACAVFMRGLETHWPLHSPYFFPLYEEASRLDMPIGIHSGIGNFSVVEAFGADDTFRTAKLAVIGAFHAMIMKGIPERFPRLRIGAIEVAAQWVPYLVHDLNLRLPKFLGKEAKPDLLRGGQLYVACQTDDDLPYILKYAGEDSLMIGSDYGHADNASELLALRRLKEKGDVAPAVIDKILCANPARFYGLGSD
ncbi:MAG TPA: amidohydrolase family protein [Candidatus Acidoferrales bacterium]|nr:amidohydrolase family protein [Candidatus Acidoferrales bacterium]